MRFLPVIACIPGDDVWALRLIIAFLSHLERGGQIADRLTGRIVGNKGGRPFDFDHLSGGPLIWVPTLIRTGPLFIGHTVCPGFDRVAAEFPWWQETMFCGPGYDYLHDRVNYNQVAIDLASHAFARLSPRDIDAAMWHDRRQKVVLVHGDPLKQAADHFEYRRKQGRGIQGRLEGRRLADWSFADYLFRHALPSFAKIFVSYQAMARARPDAVRIFSQQELIEHPMATLDAMLTHLTGHARSPAMLQAVFELARPRHVAALELELGRRIDGSRVTEPSVPPSGGELETDPGLRREALDFLASLGVDIAHFPWHEAPESTRTAAGGGT
ncbi:MAG: hypothetical protein ACOY4R_29345 [Pseudomonadota bacterium]